MCWCRSIHCAVVLRLISALLCALLVMHAPTAVAQYAGAPDQAANTGQDFFRPPQNLFQLMYGYRTSPGSGITPGSIENVTTDTVNLRFDQ